MKIVIACKISGTRDPGSCPCGVLPTLAILPSESLLTMDLQLDRIKEEEVFHSEVCGGSVWNAESCRGINYSEYHETERRYEMLKLEIKEEYEQEEDWQERDQNGILRESNVIVDENAKNKEEHRKDDELICDIEIKREPAEEDVSDCITCYYCGEKKKTKEELGEHIYIKHLSLFDSNQGGTEEGDDVMKRVRLLKANKEQEISTHMLKLNVLKPHKCYLCKLKFSKKEILKEHMVIHTNEKQYKCEVCGLRFSRKGTLKIHMLIHTNEKPHKCEVCGYRCTQKGNLKTHMLKHTNERPHKCEICGFRCARKGNLRTHMLTHTKEKPHKCALCGLRFPLKATLKEHMLIHTNERPHKCHVCGFRFAHKDNLRTHMLIHANEKPHKCDICDYRTAHKGTLNIHMLTHTKEKPHKCNACEYRSTQKGNLRRHMRIHTNSQEQQQKLYEITLIYC